MALGVKNLLASARDVRGTGLILGLGRYPGEGHGWKCNKREIGFDTLW